MNKDLSREGCCFSFSYFKAGPLFCVTLLMLMRAMTNAIDICTDALQELIR